MAINNTKSTSKSGASMELENKVNNSNSLQIQNKAGSKLNPHQIKFNKYIQQIEGLQRKLVTTAKKMDTLFGYYRDHIVPLRADEKRIRPSIIKALFVFYKRKRKELTREQHEQLGDLLRDLFQMSAMEGFDDLENDPEMDIIHKKLYKSTIKESMEEDLEDQISAALFMLQAQGIDYSPEDFDDIKDFGDLQACILKTVQQHMANQQTGKGQTGSGADSGSDNGYDPFDQSDDDNQEDEDQWERHSGQTKKKKTTAQLKKEILEKEKEILKQKNIGSIYKQLAKLFHPDLEQDPDKKLEKEMLMKELTVAYAAKDLHTLLRLELSWIQKEENNAANMASEKLAIYNEILKEQVAELKAQLDRIPHHPQYAEMMTIYPYKIPTKKDLTGESEMAGLRVAQMIKALEIFERKDSSSINEIKIMLQEKNADDQLRENFSVIDMLMEADDDDFFFR